MKRAFARAALAATLLLGAAPARAAAPATWAPVTVENGVPEIGANDLARLLGASKFWRADVRKLVLRAGSHGITLTAENPVVIVDDRTVLLPSPVRSVYGELRVPVALLRALPTDGALPRLAYDGTAQRVRVTPTAGFVDAPRVSDDGRVTRIVIPAERAGTAEVTGMSRARFRLRVGGALAGQLSDSLPAGALVRDLRASAFPNGVSFEFVLDPAATGYRIERDEEVGRVTLTIARSAGSGFERFAAEGPKGPRPLRVVVIDPGHGGPDAGAEAEGAVEKTLALALARALASELSHRTGARLVLTRTDDRGLSQDQRAEIANRSRADLVLALHFDALAGSRAQGATAYCAPAAVPEGGDLGVGGSRGVALVPWRDVALVHAVEGRGIAEAVASSLEHRGFGPARVRERLPYALVGVAAPGIALECAMLSDSESRTRVLSARGLRDLASAIADGVIAWQRGE